MFGSKLLRAGAVVGALMALPGCESYAPLPLDEQPHLATDVAALRAVAPQNWPEASAVDPTKPLDAAAVALLAVENNPDLASVRADREIAQAQVLQAGLLPNPQVTASYGFLRAGPGTTDQWTAGLSEDIKALVTLSAQRSAAELGAAQVDASLLWQEWQVIGKARLLWVDSVKQGEIRRLLGAAHKLLADRLERDRRAVDEGNLTLSAIAPDLQALADIDRQIADADRQAEQRRRDLDLLLGLEPSVQLRLAGPDGIPKLDFGYIERILPDLPRRRPDLVALKLGYGSQEEKLRAAILAQFPALILGGSGGHDNTAVYSIGPSVTMDLPIFNRNQGNIAIEKATRQKLHAEYEIRLTTATSEIRGMLIEQELLQRQLATAREAAEVAEQTERGAAAAYESGLIDARSYVDLVTAALARRQEVIVIEQSLLEQQVALATLTGAVMPIAEPVPEPPGASNS